MYTDPPLDPRSPKSDAYASVIRVASRTPRTGYGTGRSWDLTPFVGSMFGLLTSTTSPANDWMPGHAGTVEREASCQSEPAASEPTVHVSLVEPVGVFTP